MSVSIKTKEVGLTGNLSTVSLSDLLQLISVSGKTGMLVISRESQKREIYFKKGDIIYATSMGSEDELLGNLLLSQRKILKPDLEKALSLQKLTNKRLGDILYEMRTLTRDEVIECLQVQIEEIIYSLFGWNSGEFVFYDGKLPHSEQITTQLGTMNVIMEGSRRIDEWTQIKETFPSDSIELWVIRNPKIKSTLVKISVDELQLLPLISGNRTISELLSVSPLREFHTYKALYNLYNSGWVEKGEKKKAKMQEFDGEKLIHDVLIKLYSQSYQTIERFVSQKLGEGAKTVLTRCFEVQKSYNPILAKLESSDNFLDFRHLRSSIDKMPQAIRFHKLTSALNDLLYEFMREINRDLGKNVTMQVVSQIKKDTAQVVAENRWVAKEYELEEEILKTLKQGQR
ncbi:MAG: DUF4388 domain-containing protein [Candidatus Zixiibacteriota bacterium]